MKKTLVMLLASAGLAGAELSPKEFDEFRNFALTCGSGFYFAGASQVADVSLYTFYNASDGLVAYAPMSVRTFEEARQAMVASLATFIICKDRWKRPLDAFTLRKMPLPPPGFTLDDGFPLGQDDE